MAGWMLKVTGARRLQQLHQVLCIQRSLLSPQSSQKVIHVSPDISQFDQKVHITVRGLPSQTKITVFALTESVWQRNDVQFGACGHYITSQTGDVDIKKDASLGGTYTGVEPMGLFWSMKPNPFGPKNVRLVIRNVETPVLYSLSVYEGHLSLDDLFRSKSLYEPLTTKTVERAVLAEGVKRMPVKEGKIRGVLFLPPGKGPFPGVLDMFGFAGGLMQGRSALLASHGFAAYALPIFGFEDLPKSPEDQTFDYFEQAAKWLGSHPSVAEGGIGVIGTSGGAGVGLMMAYKCPEIKAFVRINGQAFHSLMNMDDPQQNFGCFAPGMKSDRTKCTETDEGLVMKDSWILDDHQLIPLWERDVHTLALVCDDDGTVHPWVTDKIQHLYPEEQRHLMEVVHYPGGGHLLETPYTPLCRSCYNPFCDTDLVWGGNVKEHAAAQEDSWKRIHQFFQKHLPSSC